MKTLTVYQIDSFTTETFKGNPAGVVINADELSAKQMQQIARELNNSETAFWLSASNNSYDGEIRYFTPTAEVPICGHATIACMVAKAIEDNLEPCILQIKTGIGILPFEIIKTDTDYRVIMTQGVFECSPEIDEQNLIKLTNALGIQLSDLDQRCPVQIASTGHSKVMIGLNSKHVLDQLKPNFNKLIELSQQIQCLGYFVFTLDSDDKNTLTYGRMFAPAIGINEDPVTGNANGPLGGYLIKNNLVKNQQNPFIFNAKQGETIGRLGTVKVIVEWHKNLIKLIKIEGRAVVIFKTEIQL